MSMLREKGGSSLTKSTKRSVRAGRAGHRIVMRACDDRLFARAADLDLDVARLAQAGLEPLLLRRVSHPGERRLEVARGGLELGRPEQVVLAARERLDVAAQR
jgi:hypothetical protein